MNNHEDGQCSSRSMADNGEIEPRNWKNNQTLKLSSRAGVSTDSPLFEELLSTLFASTAISVYGFYGHAGNAYASKSLSEASSFLSSEVDAVNSAAEAGLLALSKSSSIGSHQQPFVLSVGSTPTAHAASGETRAFLSKVLHGTLELHAGACKSCKPKSLDRRYNR